MTRLERASGELLERLDNILVSKIKADAQTTGVSEEFKNKRVAEILNIVGKSVRKKALEHLEREEPEKAKEIESLMFVFEDFLMVDDTSIRKVIMEIDNDTLALALKTASEDLKNKFLKNLSKRAAAMVVETLEYLGPKPLSEVDAAQREIMQTAQSLDEQGEIVLRRSEEEQLV
jgi:flagellar motor switch protein FliG